MKKVVLTLAAVATVVLGMGVQIVSAKTDGVKPKKIIHEQYKIEQKQARDTFKQELKSAKTATDKKTARKTAIQKYKDMRKAARDKMKAAKRTLKPSPKATPSTTN